MLVPFLMFALGVSHGIQMFNAMAHEMTAGADKLTAARRGFRMIYRPGLAALLTDAMGFALLFIIRIGVIQDIAIGATIGVVVVAFTDLMFLPVLMSYSGIGQTAIQRIAAREKTTAHPLWGRMAKLTQPRVAVAVLLIAALLFGWGAYMRKDLKIGDLDPGAPELRTDSRYNRDNAYMNQHYATSSDIFVVMLKTPKAGNSDYHAVVATERLKWTLGQLEGVQGVITYVDQLKLLNAAFSEGNLKWMAVPRSRIALDNLTFKISSDLSKNLTSRTGEMSPILVYLTDHKAETLQRIVDASQAFAAANNTETFQFLLAAGNAGIEAATNIEVEKAQFLMLALVYSVIFLVCLITYRTVRGALCVVIPLFLTSVLCEALMASYGIGVKVATLPVIAVGVGIGVDYGIYIFNKLRFYMDQGRGLTEAYYHTLNTTGRAVSFTGITLAIGVGTWMFSPIKFQADMGVLLAFMFLWNMVGAMVLLPALAKFLLPSKKVPDGPGN
jgi:predicted RND superfamily exporter protein